MDPEYLFGHFLVLKLSIIPQKSILPFLIFSLGDVSEQSGVDTGSLYGGVFAGIIILAFAIIIVALVIR